MVDKEKLNEHFKNKDYIYCINTLQKDIKDKLVQKLKMFKPCLLYTSDAADD